MKKSLNNVFFGAFLAIVGSGFIPVQPRPRILIIGDSISIGYTPFVQQDLADKAVVLHNPGNAQHTGTGLAKIDEWIGAEKWDLLTT